MISLFRKHGEFCASHPLEVVVGTVTIISSLLSMASSQQMDNEKVCGWNYECAKSQNLSRSDVIMLSFARCVALVYVYMQFRSLRRIGAKHLLGISGVFTIVSSFIFCIAFVMMFGNTMSGLYEALPFFLFLIDLSKASALAAFALSATSREEIRANIGYGMELLGPSITLDAIVETLAIGLGTISGVQQLETMCSFGCLSAVANYVAFMTFYPACLSLVLELSLDLNGRTSVQEYKHLVEELKHEHEMKKPNPVIKRVKIIMSLGLAVVHVHSRLATKHIVTGTTELSGLHVEYREPEMSIWQFYLYRLFAVHVDYGMTLILGLVLLVKYVFVDRHTDLLDIKHSMELHRSLSSTVACTQTDDYTIQEKGDNSVGTHFLVGDDSDDELTGPDMEDKSAQTITLHNLSPLKRLISDLAPRTREECVQILKSENGAQLLTDEEVKLLVTCRDIPAYKLEGTLGDYERGVSIRRQIISEKIPVEDALDYLPFSDYDYTFVDGVCCENVIGYMPVPVGVAGPLLLDGHSYMVPMATTEGTLVASTNRGCRALSQGGGVHSAILADGMSRGPVVRFPTAMKASKVKIWLEDNDNLDLVKDMFDSTSSYARLQKLQVIQAGRCLYIRFVAVTGDAMGMNMLSKGTEKVLHSLQERFPDLEIVSLSGNICTDKKPAAINWIEGRGKSVVCEAVVPAKVVQDTLKTSVQALVDLNINKNLVGSAMAGSMGGFNAHAANIVTAVFIATGQDPAQNVASSNCITLVEATGEHNKDLYISCTMPSLEVGTVGGGTVLPPQAACLKMLGVCGSSGEPGKNAKQLARIVCATVLAGELSLLSALAAGHLVRAHLRHNRSTLACKTSMEEDASRLCHSTSDLTALQSSLKTTPRPVIDQALQSSGDEKLKTSVDQRPRVVHSLPGQYSPDMTKSAASHNLSHLPQLSTDGNVLSQLPPLSADGSMITSTSKGVNSDGKQKLDSTDVKQTDSALRHRHLKDKPPSNDNSNIGTCIKHVS